MKNAHPLVRARAGIVLLLLLPLTSPVTGIIGDRVLLAPRMHAMTVAIMALVALCAAVMASRAAWRRHDIRAGLVASGFSAVAVLMLVHGLATPGGPIFDGFVPTVEIAGVFSIPVGALFIAAAISMSPRWHAGRRGVVMIQAATLAVTLTFAAVGLLAPQWLPTHPLMVAPYSYWVIAPTLVIFGWSALRAHRIADITSRPGDASMFAGIVVLALAIVIYVTSTPFDAQFWFGHVLQLIGFACISGGVISDLRRPISSWRLTEHRDGETMLTSSEELLGGYVHALTVTLSELDPSTWEHSRRVAELAVDVAYELQLDDVTIRQIAIAGLVHDIGKLRIPADILHKPGKLTAEEFDLIKAHPDFGVDLLSRLRGFESELAIVLGHHEKLSGAGYPHGLQAEQISLPTRIMSACDVYDALTAVRSYKQAWPISRALALLREESGTSFDPMVVEALGCVIRRRVEAQEAQEAQAASPLVEPTPIALHPAATAPSPQPQPLPLPLPRAA